MKKYWIRRHPAFGDEAKQGAHHFSINGNIRSIEFDENGFGYTDDEEVLEYFKLRDKRNNPNYYSWGLNKTEKP